MYEATPEVELRAKERPLCKTHDLCTNPLTHMKCGFMLCILYVRNGERYDGVRIRAGKHRRPIPGCPTSRAESRKMREDISGKNQRRSVRPQAPCKADGCSREGRRIGRHTARSFGAIHARSPEPARDD